MTGNSDVEPDLSRKQFNQLVAFVDTLPRPVLKKHASATQAALVEHGKMVFASVGCAICHVPDFNGVEGVYSDFMLHRIAHRNGTGKGGGYGAPRTPPLWGVADSAPYFHDGGSPTLQDAIDRHAGHSRNVINAYKELPARDHQAIMALLESLKAPPTNTRPNSWFSLAQR